MSIEHQIDRFLMGLDIGTTAFKGVVTDAEGHEIACAERPATYAHPRDGWIEADPNGFRDAVFGMIRELTEQGPGTIHAVALSGASGSTLLCDGTGVPVTPIINWMDERAQRDPPAGLNGLTEEAVRQVTGWSCINSFPLAQLAWLQQHEPTLYRRADRVCMNSDWLLFQLTGDWVLDHSTATTLHLQDQVARKYYQPFLDRLEIPKEKLSRLTDSGVAVGAVTPEAVDRTGLSAETVVVTGCFDHPAAARATGVLEPGQLLLSCGTSWVGFFPEMNRQRLVDAKLLCDPFLSERGGPWAGMFSVPGIGRTITAYIRQWIAPGEADPYAVFNAAAATCESSDITLDLKAPVRDPGVGRERLARAVMEAAARLLKEKLDEQRNQGFEFSEATLVGGPSHSPVWPGIIEEVTGLKLRAGTAHSGARGAAMLAGIGAGCYADETDAFENFKHREH